VRALLAVYSDNLQWQVVELCVHQVTELRDFLAICLRSAAVEGERRARFLGLSRCSLQVRACCVIRASLLLLAVARLGVCHPTLTLTGTRRLHQDIEVV
jgi:hypothetical protein